MDIKKTKEKKSYRTPGVVLAVVGMVLAVSGFVSYQQASADVGVVGRSDVGTILVITGIVMIIGAIVTFCFIVFSDSKG